MSSGTRHQEETGTSSPSLQEELSVNSVPEEERYHVCTYRQKLPIVILISCAATFSALASNIYFPALELISEKMHASKNETALTITVYMIAQGLAPSFWGPIADCVGRRQVLFWTLVLFLLSNVGLALSPSISILTALRFLQAAGSSSTISIGAGVIADVAPASERGGFSGIFAGVRQVSVALGPVIGGVVAGTLGFRAVFWFLAIFAGVVVGLVAAFLPETLRCVAGDGSVPLRGLRYVPLWRPAAPWRMGRARGQGGARRSRTNSLELTGGIGKGKGAAGSATSSSRNSQDFLVLHNEAGDVEMMPPPSYSPSSCAGSSQRGWDSDSSERTIETKGRPAPRKQQPGGPKKITLKIFFEPAKFLLEKDVACTLFFGAVIYTVFSMVTSSTTFLLAEYYGLNTLQIGLCFLPNGIGCAVGSYVSGLFLDRDFQLTSLTYLFSSTTSYTDAHGNPLTPATLQQKSILPADFPLERARLAQMPLYTTTFVLSVVLYGFSFSHASSSSSYPAHLAVPLIAQLTIGLSATAVLNVNNTLTVDLYPGKGAAATAVNNMARCLLGAVGVAVTEPALERAAPAVVFGALAAVVVVCAPAVVAECVWGMGWRRERGEREGEGSTESGR